MAVIFAEDAGRCRANLGSRLEPAGSDALLKLCESCPHAFHGFDALGALEGGPLVGVNDEHAHARRRKRRRRDRTGWLRTQSVCNRSPAQIPC
jgi:hypothetical protein